MLLICYLAYDETHIAAVQQRLAFAQPPMALVTARSLPELITHVQTLPIRAVLLDLAWPHTIWLQVRESLQHVRPQLSVVGLTTAPTDETWWRVADDLLYLDDHPELFLHRLRQSAERVPTAVPRAEDTPSTTLAAMSTPPVTGNATPRLLEDAQFRRITEVFSDSEEASLIDSFAGWVQQSCQTSRVTILLRDEESGTYVCRAQRGLPSGLVPHCSLPQTAPLCRWLASTGQLLVRDTTHVPGDIQAGLDLLQANAVIPMVFDGTLIGILGIGPRLFGHAYSTQELEGLYALCGQIAVATHHCRLHRTVRQQTEMTEHMLGVMPTGVVVINEDQRIAFMNAAAIATMGKQHLQLHGMDLRMLPTPLGDLAFEALTRASDLPRREFELLSTGQPVAVSAFALGTKPPTAMLMIEDLTEQRRLETERARRVDLEVVTNLVHYLAHELRNPLVALSTFGNLAPDHAGDPDFKEFCESVLQTEIRRVNLILEQLLVMTNHVEFQFGTVELGPLLERITSTEEMRSAVMTSLPIDLPTLYGDGHRLETAITCVLRTLVRLSDQQRPVTLRVETQEDAVLLHAEAPGSAKISPEWLLNPWEQLLSGANEEVDFGIATARYLVEQHEGTLELAQENKVLAASCRLPLRSSKEEQGEQANGAKESTRRRR
jgi:nitrogen-specific signal transduction histidine kinase